MALSVYRPAKKQLLFYALDTVTLLFSLIVAIVIGNQFQPNPVGFLITFVGSRYLLYWLWFHSISNLTVPWLKLSIHTIILTIAIPVFTAMVAFLFPLVSTSVFLLIVAPIVTLISSWVLHRWYSIFQVKT
ncbi:MAG: hypothetical protein A2Z11_00600 [Candidatus Woykebacteria bacterium RBG_16_43_9]|uniref:Uncharacterized protein n=1 Tax=Candidatus Woykebacteria bacterium RBG_16_43_9 TaxID=1802596 RepID=A0A1G1WDP5_9BACT|nr:MAG: hypothetical protein A2Z11_00600 [Candidatus Woykebacteria bacterium RBG_16_43_9]